MANIKAYKTTTYFGCGQMCSIPITYSNKRFQEIVYTYDNDCILVKTKQKDVHN